MFGKLNSEWDLKFLSLAEKIATFSKDPSTKVGAVIVDQNRRIISQAYNGFPQGIQDTDERLNNRDLKYKLILHAEQNSIIFAKQDLSDYCIYTTPFQPCLTCTKLIIQAGIKRVVCPQVDKSSELYDRWQDEFELSEELFKEAGVKLVKYFGDKKIVGVAKRGYDQYDVLHDSTIDIEKEICILISNRECVYDREWFDITWNLVKN